ncbi:uncharacterized protein G2W53_004825 [Senna tora]|uniref:Uncharacterized protein n=1 Tax=Senna tora TaxID=362788 RepID=A0A834XE07_9FABA|nr:uncharacterized protein G2W53_004825 [Senna tora]
MEIPNIKLTRESCLWENGRTYLIVLCLKENAPGGLEVASAAAAVSCLRRHHWSGSP